MTPASDLAACDAQARCVAVRALRRAFDRHHLPELLATYGWTQWRGPALRFDTSLIPDPQKVLLQLFCCSEKVPEESASRVLGREATAALSYLPGFQRHNDESIVLDSHRVVNHYGSLVYCEQPSTRASAYFGRDSLAMGRYAVGAKGCVVDYCTGVGSQAMLAGLSATRVVGFEKNRSLRHYFEINRDLNELGADLVRFVESDIVPHPDVVGVDLVLCNPPMIPAPDSVPLSLPAHGGPDGLRVVREFLKVSGEILAREGRSVFLGLMLGDEASPDISCVAETLAEVNLDLVLFVPWQAEASESSEFVQAVADTSVAQTAVFDLRHEIWTMYRSMGYSHVYSVIGVLRRSEMHSTIQMSRHYLRNDDIWEV